MEQIVEVNPSAIMADDNIRFGLKQSRIDSLAADIKQQGGITTPLWVEQLDTPVNGFSYRLTAGNYRKAAVEKLNKEESLGLSLPCIVRSPGDAISRLKVQMSENTERENMSPMDAAVAIKKFLDAGMSKVEIRSMFPRLGGKNGTKVQPASNAWLNMMVSFLEFPKKIQTRIHSGEVGVATAYELYKKPKDKWEEILADADADRLKGIEQEEKDEAKYLESLAKEQAATEKAKQEEKLLEDAKRLAEKAQEDVKAKGEIALAAYKAVKDAKAAKDVEAAKAAEERLKEIEAESQAAEKAAAKALKDVEKFEARAQTAAEAASERAKKLKDARKVKDAPETKRSKGPSAADINKSAKKVSPDSSGRVPLTFPQLKKMLTEQATLPGGAPKAQAIFKAILDCSNSVITEGQMIKDIRKITGETK